MKNSFTKWLAPLKFSPKGKARQSATESGFQSSRFATSAGNPSQYPNSQAGSPNTIEDTSDNGMRRQLVQVMLRDVLRRHGIAMQAVQCQLQVVDSRSRGPGMVVRLVVPQWNERILRYSVAFQNALRKEILRFDPKAETWLYGISWQIEDSGCPHTHMPEKFFWSELPTTQAPVQPSGLSNALEHIGPTVTQAAALSEISHSTQHTPEETAAANKALENAAALKDLEQLFFIRDQEMVRSSEATARHYEQTQPSAL